MQSTYFQCRTRVSNRFSEVKANRRITFALKQMLNGRDGWKTSDHCTSGEIV